MQSELAPCEAHVSKHFSFPTRIYYEDTDSGGVVYYANYLKFMERARTEWLRGMGFEQDQLINDLQTIFAVRSAQIEYYLPAKFNDLLSVSVTIKEFKRSYIIFLQQIFRQTPNGSLDLLVEGTIKIVSINTINFKPKRMPNQLLEILHEH
jgi:acyl-CoA thioester hydrolase